jgi:hypothetical protein
VLDHVAREFQIVQKLDGSVVMKVVRTGRTRCPSAALDAIPWLRIEVLARDTVPHRVRTGDPVDGGGQAKRRHVEKTPAS